MVWFPERREQKAVLDLCRELSFHAAQGLPDPAEKPAYGILRDWLRTRTNERHPDADGFQFMIMSAAGYDEGVTPECVFVSPPNTADDLVRGGVGVNVRSGLRVRY